MHAIGRSPATVSGALRFRYGFLTIRSTRVWTYGSLDELKADFGDYPRDQEGNINMHRPYIDELTRVNPDDPTGKSHMHRISDVMDCWFESGSMSFAQYHLSV